jgi:hypothetical protein
MYFEENLASASAGLLLGLLFEPEDGSDMLLSKVRLFLNYTVTLRRPYPS